MSRLYFDDSSRKKVLLATTAYDSPDASYTNSIQRSREALSRAGIDSNYLLLSGNCHVDDARNSVVRDFLVTDCDELVFIDADVSWPPESLVDLCKYELDVVGGVYPYRSDKQDGMPVRMIEGVYEIKNGLLEVEGLPTGFIKIKRHVIEKMVEVAEKFTSNNGFTPILFERAFRKEGRFSGDLNFCAKWRDMGGKVYAATEIQVGHTVKEIKVDSLGAKLRRVNGETLPYLKDIFRGTPTDKHYDEALMFADNRWGADGNVLAVCVEMARRSKGPIIEAGSGLSTILMSFVTDQTIYCMEHDPVFAAILRKWVARAGVNNIALLHAPLKDSWYDTGDFKDLPDHFGLGLLDGPPRVFQSRMRFFDHFDRCDHIIVDDVNDLKYRQVLLEKFKDRRVDIPCERCAVIHGNN